MNFENKIRRNIILLGVIIIFLVTMNYFFRDRNRQIESVSNRLLSLERLSPDKSLQLLYYPERGYGQQFIVVRNIQDGHEEVVYSGKRINYPEWLGNEHIFFTTYCGSGCQGFVLVNVRNKKFQTGTLEFISFDPGRADYTRFRGWFGQEFEFNGLPEKISGEIQTDQVWLVFMIEDRNGKSLGEKRFLFTGDRLKEG